MTDQDFSDHPDPDFRSPPPPLPSEEEPERPRNPLLASFNDGECRAWIAAILAMRSRRGPSGMPPA